MTDNSNKPIQFGIRSKNVLCFANGSNFFIVFQSFSPVEVASMPKVAALDEKSPPRHHECMLTSAVFIEQDEQLFLATTDDSKLLIIWRIQQKSVHFVCLTHVARSASKLTLSPQQDTLIVGDRSGDVYAYQLCLDVSPPKIQPLNTNKMMLGHCSLLTDVACSPPTAQHSFICTADRDEKIRISHFPNAYSIHAFCLGHRDFISSIQFLSETMLVSGSGDDTLRVWSIPDAKPLLTLKFTLTDDKTQFKLESCQGAIEKSSHTQHIAQFDNPIADQDLSEDKRQLITWPLFASVSSDIVLVRLVRYPVLLVFQRDTTSILKFIQVIQLHAEPFSALSYENSTFAITFLNGSNTVQLKCIDTKVTSSTTVISSSSTSSTVISSTSSTSSTVTSSTNTDQEIINRVALTTDDKMLLKLKKNFSLYMCHRRPTSVKRNQKRQRIRK